jgi:hypothetical protein
MGRLSGPIAKKRGIRLRMWNFSTSVEDPLDMGIWSRGAGNSAAIYFEAVSLLGFCTATSWVAFIT